MSSRRDFLADVGKGMIAAGLGAGLATELGLCPALAGDEPKDLSFGPLEPLVALLQETPKDKLLPILVDKLAAGVTTEGLCIHCNKCMPTIYRGTRCVLVE